MPRHAFGSRNWLTDQSTRTDIGEVKDAPRPWDRGDPIAGAVGGHFCGTEDEWRNGAIYPPPSISQYDANGLAVCCPGAGPPVVEDDVRDINFWKHVSSGSLNRWYVGGSMLGASILGVASPQVNAAFGAPFFPSRGGSINRLGVWVVNPPGVASNLNCALYDSVSDTNLSPANLVVETGDMDFQAASAGAWLSVPVSELLDPLRLYWLFVNCSANDGLGVIGGIDAFHNLGIWGVSDNVFQAMNGILFLTPYGPFPGIFPAINDGDLSGIHLPGVGVQFDG